MSKTESFEFLNELALAFRRGEKNARPQHTPILEGIRAVLAHLTSVGRLLAADEQRLTAELAEDLRMVLDSFGFNQVTPAVVQAIEASERLNRALFPATEPAEEPCTGNLWCEAPLHAEGCYATHRIPPGRLAPAEPAEEETKAEYPRTDQDFTVLGPEIFTDASGEFICWKGVNYVRQPDPTSSPVVPTPTETGPWPSLLAVPVTVQKVKDAKGYEWHRRGSTDGWRGCNGADAYTSNCRTGHRDSAPFVAAEEG